MFKTLLVLYACFVSFESKRLDRLEYAVIIEEEFEAVDIILMENRWELLAWRRDVFGDIQCFAIHGGRYPGIYGDPILPATQIDAAIDSAVFPRESNGAVYFYDEYVWIQDGDHHFTLAAIRKLTAQDIQYHGMTHLIYSTPDKPRHIERGFKYPRDLNLTKEQIKVFTTDFEFPQ